MAVLVPVLLAGVALAGPAQGASRVSSRYLLRSLGSAPERAAGYDRAKFRLWVDADRDGCDTREEVLIKEAVVVPRVRSGCALVGGRWRSRYDGVAAGDPSRFDIDHLVPLNEAWQSGAWRWSPARRRAYANDLGYQASLIAVTASSNRSKGDQEPQDWMPPRAGYACTYVKQWVAVKWRWGLTVNAAERSYLRGRLRACGWPRVPKPSEPVVAVTDGGGGGGDGSGGGAGLDPKFAYCYQAVAAGYGPYVRGVDPEYDWYTDSDGDGVVCET